MDLFVYGTLMESRILQSIIGHDLLGYPAILDGFTKYSIKDRVYPAIYPNPTDSVSGLILKNLSTNDLILLDEYEGDEYERIVVAINNKNVFCYVWKADVSLLYK